MTEQNVKDTPKQAGTAAADAGSAGAPVPQRPGAGAELAVSALVRRAGRPRFGSTYFPGAPLAQIGEPVTGGPRGGTIAEVQPADGASTPAAAERPNAASRPSPSTGSGTPEGDPDPNNPGQILENWFSTPQGAYILEWELARVDAAVADIFGYYAVQVGLPGIDFLRANRITSRLTASLAGTPSVRADAHELPFESESLDLVVLPHLLEFSSEPHQILREVERVLRPEGQVIIFCFNPVSLWGVKKLFTHSPAVPWSGEFVSVLRMKDWLKLLNFEMRGGRFGRYRPPYTSEKWLGRFGFLEQAGDRWWPVAGAVYMMQAIKRVPGMRIITPAWRKGRKAEALAASTNGANRANQRGTTLAPQYVHSNPQKKSTKE